MSNPTPEKSKTTETPVTEEKKSIFSNSWAKMGVAFLAGSILTAGIGALAINNSGDSNELGGGKSAEAKSNAIWHQFKDELPAGWVTNDLGLSEDPLLSARADLMAVNTANNCTFNILETYMEPPEFKNTPSSYLTTARVLGYGQYRDAKNATMGNLEVQSSEGVVNFTGATYEIKYDIDGDGKENEVKEGRYAYAYKEVPTTEGTIPLTEIGYVCPNAGDWSEDVLKEMVGATILNISGDEAPTIKKEENLGNEEERPASEPLPEEDEALDSSKDDKKKDEESKDSKDSDKEKKEDK